MLHTPALDDLARRIRGLEDRDALHALMIRGWRALDRKDWRTWSACWAEGGPYDWEFRRDGDGWLLTWQRLGVLWTDGEDTLRAFEPE
ncbi:hypothetical protein [Kitasatospora sp. NPDC056731]|uniref:hypothetical protein n=1 Tax=Kitasatospora sp. NPDC056731 TaxID=3155422 RepID=UPI00341D17FD